MIEIRKYSSHLRDDWEGFLAASKNGTFLHSRNYMEYHADRFDDYSLMAYNGTRCAGLLPANLLHPNTIESHSGLTYGGLILNENATAGEVFSVFSAMLLYCHDRGIDTINLKMAPDFYATVTQQELEFALFATGAELYRVDITLAADRRNGNGIRVQDRRVRGARKAEKAGVTVQETDDFSSFWNRVLIPALKERHDTSPVHSLAEISHLKQMNTDHIRQFNACKDGHVLAGITIYETRTTAHAQYIASNREGRETGALDYLVFHLMNTVFSRKPYFNLGIVNEREAPGINTGLLEWKEGFGARAYAHRFYRINTGSARKLDGL